MGDFLIVRVQTIAGKVLTLKISRATSVGDLCLAIEQQEGFPANRMVLLHHEHHSGTVLPMVESKRLVMDYGVQTNHLVLMLLASPPVAWSNSSLPLTTDLPKFQLPLRSGNHVRLRHDVERAATRLPTIRASARLWRDEPGRRLEVTIAGPADSPYQGNSRGNEKA